MKQCTIETAVGLIIIALAACFFLYAYKVSGIAEPKDGYSLGASFDNIEGITIGSDVKLSGIKIGYVDDMVLENDSFLAKVTLRIDSKVVIPKDSRLIVSTSGLVGNKYMRVTPGTSDVMLTEGDKFIYTQSALNIEDLISKVMYSITQK